jgi:hypothetical protein
MRVKPSVYIETSVISYLVGWLNRNDLQVAAHQELTRRWHHDEATLICLLPPPSSTRREKESHPWRRNDYGFFRTFCSCV